MNYLGSPVLLLQEIVFPTVLQSERSGLGHVRATFLRDGNRRWGQGGLTLIGRRVHVGLSQVLLRHLRGNRLQRGLFFWDRLNWSLSCYIIVFCQVSFILRGLFRQFRRDVLEQVLVGFDYDILGGGAVVGMISFADGFLHHLGGHHPLISDGNGRVREVRFHALLQLGTLGTRWLDAGH